MRGASPPSTPISRTSLKPGLAGCGINTADRINAGLTGCWLFNEGSGLALFDIVGGKTGIGVALAYNQGQFGLAGKFNGTTSKVTVAAAPVMASPWTISGWINWTTLTNLAVAFGFNNGTNGAYIASTTANLKIGSNGETAGNGATALATGRWYHVAMYWDGTKLNAFLNGAFEYNVTPSGNNWKSANQTQFGVSAINSVFHSGSIDIIRVHNRALQRGEIARLYSEPFAGILTVRRRFARIGTSAGRTLSGALIEANDTFTALAQVAVKLSGGPTEANDVFAAAVQVAVKLAGAITEANDAMAGNLSGASRTISGAITEANDAMAAAFKVAVKITGNPTEANDLMAAIVRVALKLSGAITEANDSMSGFINPPIGGSGIPRLSSIATINRLLTKG